MLTRERFVQVRQFGDAEALQLSIAYSAARQCCQQLASVIPREGSCRYQTHNGSY